MRKVEYIKEVNCRIADGIDKQIQLWRNVANARIIAMHDALKWVHFSKIKPNVLIEKVQCLNAKDDKT